MHVEQGKLGGVLILHPHVFEDERGVFVETYQEARLRAVGVDCHFVQDNHSRSIQRTLRGLHFQASPGQAKLVYVAAGRIFDVVVDIRPQSPTFGQWEGMYLDAERRRVLFIPVGFAHGFCVTSEVADVYYKVSAPYDASTEGGIAYDDPSLGIQWPVTQPILSARDQRAPSFAELAARLGRSLG
ncbi:MAG: dTDP-4-dehydrorhamnose 3,5-epimerase [Polyangiaceae bacterium]